MKIALDLDGVVCNTIPLFVKKMNEKTGIEKRVDDIWHYNLSKVYRCGSKTFQNILNSFNYKDVNPMSGSIRVIRELREKGFEIYFMTSRADSVNNLFSRYRIKKETREWIDIFFLGKDYEKIVFSKDKVLYAVKNNIKIIVDDNMKTAIEGMNGGLITLLFDYPYNRKLNEKGVIRVYNWNDIKNIFKEFK